MNMVLESFGMVENKICILCNKRIYTNKEAWAVIIDYNRDVEVNRRYYHTGCLTDLLTGRLNQIQRNVEKKTINLARGMIGRILGRKMDVET